MVDWKPMEFRRGGGYLKHDLLSRFPAYGGDQERGLDWMSDVTLTLVWIDYDSGSVLLLEPHGSRVASGMYHARIHFATSDRLFEIDLPLTQYQFDPYAHYDQGPPPIEVRDEAVAYLSRILGQELATSIPPAVSTS
ncbi:hypothetical protein SAMN06295885_2531 [Rathayibacter oskolensis]|uniref:Uncharacterized protein n=1 Tax=Rathayibacter oskolensis TaxID=1891671 RepID=A0A1X7P666_9MICO|nr:hypothetical protein [Rathayibacter oskolensis]SMH45392.1 hypothetical protein SAMN06295885_2531 [Rathayibacter oskolensis]